MLNSVRRLIRHVFPDRWRKYANECIGRRQRDWARIVMDDETRKFMASLAPGQQSVLEISGRDWEQFGFARYRSLCYPEFDICSQVTEEKYDIITAEQVFEHVLRPRDALRNICSMLNPGGVVLITTPFLLKYHGCPIDVSRWTEQGLAEMLTEVGFSVISSGGWGNRECVIANLSPDDNWAGFNPLWGNLKNDPRFPIAVWAFGRRPA